MCKRDLVDVGMASQVTFKLPDTVSKNILPELCRKPKFRNFCSIFVACPNSNKKLYITEGQNNLEVSRRSELATDILMI